MSSYRKNVKFSGTRIDSNQVDFFSNLFSLVECSFHGENGLQVRDPEISHFLTLGVLVFAGADPNVYTRAGGHQIPNAAGTIGVTGSSFWRRPNMPTPADVVDMLVNSGVNLFTSDRDGTRRLILGDYN